MLMFWFALNAKYAWAVARSRVGASIDGSTRRETMSCHFKRIDAPIGKGSGRCASNGETKGRLTIIFSQSEELIKHAEGKNQDHRESERMRTMFEASGGIHACLITGVVNDAEFH